MRVAPRIPETVAAVDWSGARGGSEQRKRICTAVAEAGGIRALDGRTREQTIELVESLPAPLVVGIDMSFGAPAWFARQRGCSTIDDVWALAALDGERWLEAEPPFWRDRCGVPADQRFRACEVRLRDAGFPAKSIFQLVGNGQVGVGSVRGMPLLARLRAAGFAIWPFDPPADRTVMEIYPSLLRKLVEHDGMEFASEHERDAVLSATAMWEHRDSFATLTAANDPVTRIEGDVWMPPTVGYGRAS